MKRIQDKLRQITGGERLVLLSVTIVLALTVVMAALAFFDRPADISNPDVAFKAKKERAVKEAKAPRNRTVDWPIYGYDRARTKFLDAQKVRPPFRKLWKYNQDELIEFAPVIHGQRMYLIDNDGVYIALNVKTGQVIWKKRLANLNASSPAFSNGVLYSVSLDPAQAIAVSANSGKVLWRKKLPGRAESSPMVIGDRMYFGSEPGTFFALDTANGKTVWQTQLGGEVKAAPAFDKGTLFVGDYGGKFWALRASDGAVRWQSSDLGTGFGNGRFYSTPAVAFGRVYVGNVDGRVYSFDQKTGETAWTFSAGNYVYSGIAVAQTKGTKPTVYFGSHDRNAYAVDAQSGKLVWKSAPGGQVSGPATVIGGVVYMSTFSGDSTIGFDIRSGRRVFKFDDGEYGPAVSNGENLFIAGGSDILALKPVKVEGDYKTNTGSKGIIPPSQLRKLRVKARDRAKAKGSGNGGGEKGTGSGAKAKASGSKGGGGRSKSTAPKKSAKSKRDAGSAGSKRSKSGGKPKRGGSKRGAKSGGGKRKERKGSGGGKSGSGSKSGARGKRSAKRKGRS